MKVQFTVSLLCVYLLAVGLGILAVLYVPLSYFNWSPARSLSTVAINGLSGGTIALVLYFLETSFLHQTKFSGWDWLLAGTSIFLIALSASLFGVKTNDFAVGMNRMIEGIGLGMLWLIVQETHLTAMVSRDERKRKPNLLYEEADGTFVVKEKPKNHNRSPMRCNAPMLVGLLMVIFTLAGKLWLGQQSICLAFSLPILPGILLMVYGIQQLCTQRKAVEHHTQDVADQAQV